MTEKNSFINHEIDALRCTLDLSATESAELEKLNNVDLLNDCKIGNLTCFSDTNNSQEAANEAANIGSLEAVSLNHACSSSHTPHTAITLAETAPINESTRSNRISRTRSSKRMNPSLTFPNELDEIQTPLIPYHTVTPSISTLSAVKDEQVVVIDDNTSLIDLTKENDDVMIISVENDGSDNVIRNRKNRVTRLASQRFASALNSSPPTSLNSDTFVESASTSTDNDTSDMEIIQVLNMDANKKTHRPCVDITYHFCSTRTLVPRSFITNTHYLRQNRRNNMNSTIVLDDERTDNSQNQPNSSDFSTLQTTPEPNSENPLTVQTDTTNNTISSQIRSPKRLRLEKTGKKDNTKITQSKQSSSSSNNSIHCPICLETLDELKSHNRRLKSTFCGHILCNICLEATFKSNGEGAGNAKSILCPTCRTKLTKSKIHDLFI